MSRIHGLTPRGGILWRVDRCLRRLREELSEINASVFNASLIELRSIKTFKLNQSAPFSPLASHLVWQFYSKFKFLPIHRSSPSRRSLPLTCSTQLCRTASIFALRPAAIYQRLLLSSSRDSVDTPRVRFAAIEMSFGQMRHLPIFPPLKNKSMEET